MENASVKKVSYSELLSHVSSKTELYNVLAVKGKLTLLVMTKLGLGQIVLPPLRYCSLRFLKDILKGRKKYLQNFELQTINVPRYSELTMKRVLNEIKVHTSLLEYLPDASELNEKTVERSYLFNLVNTLDGTYFPALIDELEKLKEAGGKKQEFVEIDHKLHSLLESVYTKSRRASSQRSLGVLKVNATQRKAPIVRKTQLREFQTKLDPASTVDDRPRDYLQMMSQVN